jgi:uncharacterized protein (TIGR04255 family)
MPWRNRLPVHLARTPIVEAIVELRFQPSHPATGDLMVGLLFPRFSADYPKLVTLPIANLPPQVRAAKPIDYQPIHRFEGPPGSLSVGGKMASVACAQAQYPGWRQFRARAVELLGVLREINQVSVVERIALRYVNLLADQDFPTPLQAMDVSLNIIGAPAPDAGLHIRTELKTDRHTSVVQFAGRATASLTSGEQRHGALLDIDTIRTVSADEDFWSSSETILESVHNEAKRVFFSLLTDESIAKFEPTWGDNT